MQTSVQDAAHCEADLPLTLHVDLVVRDRETIGELCQHLEVEDRDIFALDVLEIGVLALRQARGQLDVDAIRHESERLLDGLAGQLNKHSEWVQENLTRSLKEYFDPDSGRFQERVKRLIEQDGELEQLLRRQVGGDDSVLCSTLSAHFGEESPLMKTISPDQSNGLLSTLRETCSPRSADPMAEPLPVFVYGTLQRGEERAGMWPCEPVRVVEATVRGRLFDLGPYPALTRGVDVVQGELWYLRDEDVGTTLRVLDEIECFGQADVDLYVREVVECSLADGRTQRAYAYFIANPDDVADAQRVPPDADGICRWTS